jgi:predicted Ser/Thr protein kinase
LVEGTTLAERYRIEERIASGGMGAIYRAVDERLNRTVAIKVLRDDFSGDPAFVERFRREARAVAALSHPRIANVYDYGEDDRPFIVMEFAEGTNLARILEGGPLSAERTCRIGAQVAAALAHAHAAGIVHRDVKPANIIVAPGDRVKITDFGIALAAGEATLTGPGTIIGTAHYLAPEQADGGRIGPATDVYSTGIVLFEMLTGAVPFTGDSAVSVAMKHVSEDVPSPSSLSPAVPPELDAVVGRATAKHPANRFPDAGELEVALLEAARPTVASAGDAPTMVLQPEGPTVWPIPGDRYDPRRIGRWVLLIFAALLLGASAALVWRVATAEESSAPQSEGGSEATGAGAQPTSAETSPSPEASIVVVPSELIGMDGDDAQQQLEALGFAVVTQEVEGEKHLVVGVDPPPGSSVTPGVDTITLLIGNTPPGHDEDDEDEGDD